MVFPTKYKGIPTYLSFRMSILSLPSLNITTIINSSKQAHANTNTEYTTKLIGCVSMYSSKYAFIISYIALIFPPYFF